MALSGASREPASLASLPFEIHEQIFADLGSHDFAILGRVSKALHEITTPRLYGAIEFSWGYHEPTEAWSTETYARPWPVGPQVPLPPAHLLLRALLLNQGLAGHIHSFSLLGEPLFAWRMMVTKDRLFLKDVKSARWGDHPETMDDPFYVFYYSHSIFQERHLEEHPSPPPPPPFPMDSFSSAEIEALASRLGSHGVGADAVSLGVSRLRVHVLPVLLTLLPSLRRLKIESDFFRHDGFRSRFAELIHSGHFAHLESVTLCSDVPYWPYKTIDAVRHWERALLAPLNLQSLRHLDINTTLDSREYVRGPTAVESLSIRHLIRDPASLRWPRKKTVWAAALHERPQFLRKHLENMKCLRSLEYRSWVRLEDAWDLPARVVDGEVWDWRSLPDPLFHELQPVCKTLERLVITARVFPPDDDELHRHEMEAFQTVWGVCTHLREFPRLKVLEIPWTLLVGYEPAVNIIDDWDRVLPPSLRHLTLTDHLIEFQGWRAGASMDSLIWDDTVVANVARLVPWLAGRRAHAHERVRFGLKIVRDNEQEPPGHLYWKELWAPDDVDRVRRLCAASDVDFTFSRRGEDFRYGERQCRV